MSARGGDGPYVRAVEAAWSKLRGRPTVLSPRDFETVSAWRRKGIPLSVVLEVFEHRARRHGGGGRSLAYLAAEIDAAWSAVAQGRAAVAPPPESEAPESPWREAALRQPERSELRAFLDNLAVRSDAGAAAGDLEAVLDDALSRLAPQEVVAAAETEAARALAPYATRMAPDELRRTRTRAVNDRLRRMLSLPPRLG